jgi:hypothetical protein
MVGLVGRVVKRQFHSANSDYIDLAAYDGNAAATQAPTKGKFGTMGES